MRYNDENRKHKNTPTTELLDFVGNEYKYDDEKNRELKQQYENEIEHREPFDDMKREIERLRELIRELTKIVSQLEKHTHDPHNGLVTVYLENQDYAKKF